MKQRTALTFRLSEKLNDSFDKVCRGLDLNKSEEMRILVQKFVIENSHLLNKEDE